MNVLGKGGRLMASDKEFREAGCSLRKQSILKIHDFKSL